MPPQRGTRLTRLPALFMTDQSVFDLPMSRHRVQSPKREQILRAATSVFSTREFHAVPVEDVAVAAGVGKGTLYLYFPTKEQLFYATILEALDVLIAELRAAVHDRDGEDALTAF